MIRLSREQRTYQFNASHPPAAHIPDGATVILDVEDAGSHRIVAQKDIETYVPRPDYTNPATGPIYVLGAEPGDSLVVHIERIELDRSAYTKISPGTGVLVDHVEAPAAQIWQVDGDHGAYTLEWGTYRLPAQPMIGTIGTAPAGEGIYNSAPGNHGGNLDVPSLCEGASIYLPVFVPGALLGLGDVHARQGDGELSGVALEARATVTARVDRLPRRQWARPWIETETTWVTIGINHDVPTAIRQAVSDMLALLREQLDLAPHDALMLLGVAGDLRAGQVMLDSSTPGTVYLTAPKP